MEFFLFYYFIVRMKGIYDGIDEEISNSPPVNDLIDIEKILI